MTWLGAVMRIANCGIVQRVFTDAWAEYDTVATLPISPSAVGISCISTVRSSPAESLPSCHTRWLPSLSARGRRADQPRAVRHFVANHDVLGRLAADVADLHDELGRLADLDFRRGEFLDHQRRLLRAFERAFARLAGAIDRRRRVAAGADS